MKAHHSSATRVFGIVLAVAIAQCADAAEAEAGQAQFVRQAPVQVEPQPLPDLVAPLDPEEVKVTDVRLKGRIEGRNITFSLELTATTKKSNVEIPLVLGGVVLDNVKKSTDKRRVRYDPGTKTYFMKWDIC